MRIVAATLSRVLLTTALSLTMWAAAPVLLGWHPTTVATGSMEPHIHPGDVVSARPVSSEDLKLGMVLLVDDPDHPHQLRLHRLVEFSPDGLLVLRGDANPQDDSSHVRRQAVHGVGALRVPFIAVPILWLHQRAWVKVALLVVLILALVAAMGLDRGLIAADEPAEPAEPAEPTEPADSTEPAGPTEAAEPAEPADPAEPAEPAEPAIGAAPHGSRHTEESLPPDIHTP